MAFFSKDIGIDLGTANTLVYIKGKGIVLREPSVVAVQSADYKVLAVGNQAKDMIGRTPGNIIAVSPLKEGVIADFETTRHMLKYFIKKATKGDVFSRPRVVVCIPYGVTDVERRAVEEAVIQAGASKSYLIEEPMAAAIGANLPVAEATGSMVVDIGGGTSEVAVISLGGIVTSKSLRIAGNRFDESIMQYIKKKHNLLIGERTAELIKMTVGSAYPPAPEDEKTEDMLVKGRDLLCGLPKNIMISADEIREALEEPVLAIVDAVKATLETTPPELAADIVDRGITLTGGGALLRGLDRLIESTIKVPVFVANNPLDCVAEGTGRALDNIDSLKGAITSF